MSKTRVLFVCVHNSARSQMAEELLNRLGGDRFEAESAGLDAGSLNPMAVEVMREIGYDISQKTSDSAFDFFKQGRRYSCIIKVCDEFHGEKCPIFPFVRETLEWNLPDPSEFTGTYEERLQKTREVRDVIKTRVEEFINSN